MVYFFYNNLCIKYMFYIFIQKAVLNKKYLNLFADEKPAEQTTQKAPKRHSLETQQVGGEFAEFLRTAMRKQSALDVSKHVRSIIEKMQHAGELPIEDLTDIVQDFYQTMADRVQTHSVYKGRG
jgi:hypothetical protein